MKILISTDTYYPHVNGASYFAQRLAHALSKRGHAVAVVAPGESFVGTKKEMDGVTLYGTPSYPVFFYPKFRFALPYFGRKYVDSVFTDFHPDILHGQMHLIVGRAAIKSALKRNIPVVVTNHFMPENLVHYLHGSPRIEKFVIDFLWRDFARIYNKAVHVTTQTKAAKDLIQPFLKKPVEIISCGIDLKRFNQNNDGAYLRERYQIPNKPCLLYVGRLDKEKRLDLALRAFHNAAKNTDMHFIIAGNGAEKKELTALAESLGISTNVTFTGFVPNEDLPNLYTLGYAFIIGGVAELQSIVTMEAMASGLPILAVNAVALPELVHDGENGFLFEDGDEATLTKRMQELFTNSTLHETMSRKSLEYIQAHNIELTLSKFESIYRNYLNSNEK